MWRADNSVKIWQTLPIDYPKPDLHNINTHTKFGDNPLIFTQVIIRKRKYGRISADNFVKIRWNLPINSPSSDLHNINAHTKLGENPSMFTQVIIRKRRDYRVSGYNKCWGYFKEIYSFLSWWCMLFIYIYYFFSAWLPTAAKGPYRVVSELDLVHLSIFFHSFIHPRTTQRAQLTFMSTILTPHNTSHCLFITSSSLS